MPIAKKIITLSLLTGFAAALATFSVPVSAQAQGVMKGWNKLCGDAKDKDGNKVNICNTMNTIISDTGQPLTMINLIEVKKDNRSERSINIQVPTGRSIPEGIKIKVDNDAEKTVPYVICEGPVCVADDVLTDEIIAQLKKGKNLTVTSINSQGVPNPLDVTLSDFDKVFSGAGMREQDFKAEQEKLQKAIQKKQQEENDKMLEAQKKAKEAN